MYSLVCLVWSIPKKQNNVFFSFSPNLLPFPLWTKLNRWTNRSHCFSHVTTSSGMSAASALLSRWRIHQVWVQLQGLRRARGSCSHPGPALRSVLWGEFPAPLGTGWWLCPALWPCEKLLSQTSLNLSNWSPLQDRNIFHCPVTFPLVSPLCLFLVYSEDDGVRGTQKAEDKIKKWIQAITLRLEM